MKKLKYIFILSAVLISCTVFSQTEDNTANIMTLQKAIETAMVNNYGLKIAGNSLKQAENNYSIGNAGLLPSVSLNGGADISNTNIEKQYDSEEGKYAVASDGNGSTGYNTNIRLDYTIFDGFGNLYNYKRLKQSDELQQTLYKQQMEGTILQVVQNYYEVCRSQQNLHLAKESMDISRERFSKAKDKNSYGQATKLDVLNAEVDFNNDSANVLMAEQGYLMSIKDLNVVMGISIGEYYQVDDEVVYRDDLTAESVKEGAIRNNSELMAQKQQEELTETALKITKSARFPKLSAYGQYGMSRQDYDTGELLYNQNDGVTAGLSLRFNVFDGKKQRTKEKNAKLNLSSELERTRLVQSEIERDAANAFTDYSYKRKITELQQSSLEQAKLNFEQTKEMFQLGRVTSIEFRTAQQNLLNSANQYNEALFKAKVAEYNLLKLTGELIGTYGK